MRERQLGHHRKRTPTQPLHPSLPRLRRNHGLNARRFQFMTHGDTRGCGNFADGTTRKLGVGDLYQAAGMTNLNGHEQGPRVTFQA